jgi:hypothetical protein
MDSYCENLCVMNDVDDEVVNQSAIDEIIGFISEARS